MGRVKRYKKLKACDPCAPRRSNGLGEEEEKYDMPPADSDDEGACVILFDSSLRFAVANVCSNPSSTINPSGTSRKRRRQEKRWARDALRDDEYVELLEEKASKRRKKQLPEVSWY